MDRERIKKTIKEKSRAENVEKGTERTKNKMED